MVQFAALCNCKWT